MPAASTALGYQRSITAAGGVYVCIHTWALQRIALIFCTTFAQHFGQCPFWLGVYVFAYYTPIKQSRRRRWGWRPIAGATPPVVVSAAVTNMFDTDGSNLCYVFLFVWQVRIFFKGIRAMLGGRNTLPPPCPAFSKTATSAGK